MSLSSITRVKSVLITDGKWTGRIYGNVFSCYFTAIFPLLERFRAYNVHVTGLPKSRKCPTLTHFLHAWYNAVAIELHTLKGKWRQFKTKYINHVFSCILFLFWSVCNNDLVVIERWLRHRLHLRCQIMNVTPNCTESLNWINSILNFLN